MWFSLNDSPSSCALNLLNRAVSKLELRVEGERERALAEAFGDRAEPLREPEALPHVRLQMDEREVTAGLDAFRREIGDHLLAIHARGKDDHVDEPRAAMVGVV